MDEVISVILWLVLWSLVFSVPMYACEGLEPLNHMMEVYQ